ncbi:MAG: Coenzyme F420 hydrogenase/dehydrogenase, beta subunit C-terminal domain [Candidatus Bathyarchaeota archaeon]|nr:Coenzyme F420 hydrogenase/dehydrogenase, beta subunit C-terminal domain [Candidatus Bathyarchaeota archaeon]
MDLISKIVDKKLCVGCGTCVGSCPTLSLEIKETEYGSYSPIFKGEGCSDCGVCLAVCPAKNMPFNSEAKAADNTPIGVVRAGYIGCSGDQEILKKGSSGGLTSSILTYALESKLIDGAIVVTMDKEEPWRTKVVIAKTKEEILQAAGSKYAVVPVNSVFAAIRKSKGKFALVGLPCHIRGLELVKQRGMRSISDKIVFTVGLYCGLNLRTTATTFLTKKLGITNKETIQKLEYRRGFPGALYIKSQSGEVSLPKKDYRLINLLFQNEACSYCDDLTNQKADISIGDLFDAESKGPVGMLLTRSKTGESIAEEACLAGYLKLKKTNVNRLIRSQKQGLIHKKKGAPVREYLRTLNVDKSDPNYVVRPKSVPTAGQKMYETLQRSILFGKINKQLVRIAEHLPLTVTSVLYRHILTVLFVLGKFCYE